MPNKKRDNSGRNLYLLTLLAALAALAAILLSPDADAAPAHAAQKPLENEIVRIARSNQPAPMSSTAIVREVNWAQLQEVIASESGPIVIEFYRQGYPDDPNVADDCDKCSQQLPAYEQAAKQYAGKITFLRFDVDQHPQLMQLGLVVFPTHVFMVHTDHDLWVRSIRGFLNEKQFEELIEELFTIKP